MGKEKKKTRPDGAELVRCLRLCAACDDECADSQGRKCHFFEVPLPWCRDLLDMAAADYIAALEQSVH